MTSAEILISSNSPLQGIDLEFERDKSPGRDVELFGLDCARMR